MWYVKDEFTEKIYFKSDDVRKTQNFATRYNSTFKFAGQRMFRFVISYFSGIVLFGEDKVDINRFTKKYNFFDRVKYSHPLSVKDFEHKHIIYVKKKYDLMCKLCKKYHLWSYNGSGRKCDSFDF